MVEPSTRGVANILSSVNKNKGMLAFIQTSSVASVGFREDRLITEADWSTTSIEENPYTFAKRKGEEAVWEMTRGKPYKVAAINPTMVRTLSLSPPPSLLPPNHINTQLWPHAP
jgi:nucleoside-diphosphate-sugar epimerase